MAGKDIIEAYEGRCFRERVEGRSLSREKRNEWLSNAIDAALRAARTEALREAAGALRAEGHWEASAKVRNRADAEENDRG